MGLTCASEQAAAPPANLRGHQLLHAAAERIDGKSRAGVKAGTWMRPVGRLDAAVGRIMGVRDGRYRTRLSVAPGARNGTSLGLPAGPNR